jgi:hypothetical protein
LSYTAPAEGNKERSLSAISIADKNVLSYTEPVLKRMMSAGVKKCKVKDDGG